MAASSNSEEDIKQIFKFAIDNKIKFDNYCLEYATRNDNRLSNILINDFNCEITIGSLMPIGRKEGQITIFQKLLNQHQITKDVMKEQLDLDLTGYLEKMDEPQI